MASSDPLQDALEPIANIDRVIHEPARLMIMAFLSVVEKADFIFTMKQTGLTRGNLSTHMSKLEEAGYLRVEKEFVDKRPMTLLMLTPDGKHAFVDYRKNMQHLFKDLP